MTKNISDRLRKAGIKAMDNLADYCDKTEAEKKQLRKAVTTENCYTGIRTKDVRSVVVWHDDQARPLKVICRHSPDGFEWGYGGSGPSDLALSILTDYFRRRNSRDAIAEAGLAYQDFKWRFLANIKEDAFKIEEQQITDWLAGREG
jgi:hypothetical protein